MSTVANTGNQKRYRVLYVEKPVGVGGAVTGLYELVRGLDTDRYEPVVLFYERSHPYWEPFEEIGARVVALNEAPASPLLSETQASGADQKPEITSNPFSKLLAKGQRFTKTASQIARAVQLIKREKIDLVHQNDNLPKNRETIIAARLAGVPQISHIRTLAKLSSFDRLVARCVDRFVYMSRAIEQLYLGHGIPAAKGQVIYDGFNAEASEKITPDQIASIRAEFGLTEQDQLISNVGRLDSWKGQDYFIEAIAQIVQLQPNVKALLVGEASLDRPWNQEYYQKLQRLVADLHLTDRVIFTGLRKDVPQIMAASDIVVHSSSEPEPFGRVIVEAMVAGRPVVATAAGGVLDIIEDNVTGLLVPLKDAERMAKAIYQLLCQPERARQMGQDARQRAKERFSVEQHCMVIQQVYQRFLGHG
ncbi:glycosyltransferase family 4 protein [Leptothermofonsia sp. ETS-13]|uniref:glycosyltransferase family 4 protein n=1 Tax=Leptothermofonsia sp. ETS-13 TaxID=3035696 RepID=UPI003BA0B9FB